MKSATSLWLLLLIGIIIQIGALYISRASCYNEELAILQGELKDPNRQCTKSAVKANPSLAKQCLQVFVDTTWETKKCEPSIQVSDSVKKISSHVYFIGMFVLPVWFFICFIVTFAIRAKRPENE